MVALRVEGVSKRYGRLSALDRVSLSVAPGEIVAVVGENGAGKSTLVRCIAGEVEPDEGRVDVPRPCGVVWQDLGLCDDLDVVANVFLGRERGRLLLAEARMLAQARRVLDRFGSDLADLRTPVEALSRGERQEVALARALATEAQLLLLDEPTASLSVVRRTQVVRLLRQLRDEGRAILLVSHDLDEVFALADRIVVLRHGRVVASVSPAEVHADDVTALMSGIETESMARRQLNRLTSLVAQLSAAGPAASLPIVLSATAVALGQDMLCIHLRDAPPAEGGTEPVLRRAAAVGLPSELSAATAQLPVGTAGGPVGMAAHLAELVVAGDIRDELAWAAYLPVAAASGVRRVWSAPIVGVGGVLGTITGFGRAASRLDPDLAELVSLYAGHAAQVIEREQLLAEAGEAAAARRSQALQRELLQQLSHELRTPLTAIHGYASTLQQPDLTWDEAATGRFLAAISAESERMERLVGDLLDSSAIESGLLWLRRDWTDLRLVLAAARDCVPERKQISLTVAPDLEPVWADHDRLQQVFVNLLENAVRHGPAGGEVEVVAQHSPVDSTRAEVLVRDGGPGVPPELAEQIFEPRVRGKGGTGAGLGLAIARGIAEAHGGSCRLLAGPVTTFQVLLPVEPVELEAREERPEAGREEARDG